jgi:hypothetical protein
MLLDEAKAKHEVYERRIRELQEKYAVQKVKIEMSPKKDTR